MARRSSAKRNHRSRSAAARRGVVGVATGAGAFVVFGLIPLAAAPVAGADELDLILDPLLTSVSSVDPTLGTDLSALVGSFDPTFAGDHAATAAASPDFAHLLNQDIYTPIHTAEQDWITSKFGEQVDTVLNTTFGQNIIGNGAPGTDVHPDGGAGGLVFGDGGNGWNSTDADVAGGNGGAAFFGNGGNGGDGFAGTAGGAGGNTAFGIGGNGGDGGAGVAGLNNGIGGAGGAGGNANGFFFGNGGDGGTGGNGVAGGVGGNGGDGGNGAPLGDGGNGGNGGNGGAPGDLPALGGAGGTAGMLGSHGAVGQSGTLADVSLIGPPPAQSAGAGGLDLPIGTTGTWLTDSDGRVVILHGLSQIYKVPPFEPSADGFGNDDAAFLAANGFNAVRVGVIWEAVEPEPGVFNDAYLASIAQTVQTLANHGIVSLLDMEQDDYGSTFAGEGAPAWATETGGLPNPDFGFPANYFLNPAELNAWSAFFSNANGPDGVGLENSYAQMWEHVANYFKGNPDVAGFEVMNEAWPGFSWPLIPLGSPFFGMQELTPFFNEVTAAIRAVDPTTPVYFEPNLIFESGVSPVNLGTVDYPHTVFTFEEYCPQSEFFSVSFGCAPYDEAVMGRAVAYAQSHDVPAVLTEFGSTDNDTSIADMMQAADQHRIGWTEWAYTGNDITSTNSTGQALVYNPELPPVGANVDTAKLATLAAPYPQVVAGTPNSWSFDTGTFQLSYSTEKVDGLGSFGAGAQTDISVPAIEYPNGYQVSVTGGQVVSAPNAPELVIASDGGAGTVNVTVSPAADGAPGAG